MLQATAARTSEVPAVDQEREYFRGEHLPHQSQTTLSGAMAGTSCGRTPSVFVKAHTAEVPIICAAVHMPGCASHNWKLRHYYFLLLVTILFLSPVWETEATEFGAGWGWGDREGESRTRKYTTLSKGRTAVCVQDGRTAYAKTQACSGTLLQCHFCCMLLKTALQSPALLWSLLFVSVPLILINQPRLKSGSHRARWKLSQNTVKPNCSPHL